MKGEFRMIETLFMGKKCPNHPKFNTVILVNTFLGLPYINI